MLLDDLFIIDDWQPGDGLARAFLRINWGHPIFEGHFPGRPVVPGACLLQIVKELMSMALGSEVRLVRADQIKFISMIGPDEDETMWMNVTWDSSLPSAVFRVTAEGIHANEVCFRLKGSFQAGSDYAD
jgi:3-hydroxyacyl-[acyl-carrier-protein] dehydratase